MARDGSGNYFLATDPFIPESVISSTQMNLALSDIAQAISESLPVSGERGMIGPFQLADGTNSAPAFAFNSESSLGLYRPGSGKLGFCAEGAEQARLTANGLIIGSTTDTGEKLQVNGHTKVTGTVSAARVETTGLGNVVSGGNVVAGGNVYATANLMGQRALVAAGTAAEPSINLNGYPAGIWFPTSGEMELIGDNTPIARFGTTQTDLPAALNVTGVSTLYGAVDARSTIGADGTIFTLADLAANGNCAVGGNLWGSRALVAAGTAAEPSFGLQSQITGMYFPAVDAIELVTDNVSSAKFTKTTATVNDVLTVKGTTAAYSTVHIGSDRTVESASTIDFHSTVAAGAAAYDFRIIRGTGTNGVVQFINSGTGRMQFNIASGEIRNQTSGNNLAVNYVAATTSADNGVFSQSLTAAGTYQLLFKNAAMSQTLTPYQITRNATGGTGAQIWRVGGDITTAAGQTETFRITENNRFLIGNSADAIYSNDTTDVSASYYFHGARLGGNSASISLGSESSFNANLAFGRNNSAGRRVIVGQIIGKMDNSAAGSESGQLYLQTKGPADAAAVTRFTIDGTGATFSVPILGKLNVNTPIAQTLFAGVSDITADYPLQVSRSGGGAATGVALGSNNADRSTAVFYQTNSAGTRLTSSRIVGFNSATTAGAEKGYLVFDTKAAADVSPVTRLTLSETGATFTVPVSSTGDITAPNLAYKTKVVSPSALTNDGIYSATASFTVNTTDCADGRVFTIYNNSTSAITITQGAGLTLRLAGTATTGNRTLAARGLCTITCITNAHVVISGSGDGLT